MTDIFTASIWLHRLQAAARMAPRVFDQNRNSGTRRAHSRIEPVCLFFYRLPSTGERFAHPMEFMKISIFVLLTLMVGCASVDLPNVESPIGKIAAAEERSIVDNPQAKLHLQLAKDATEESVRLKKDGNERGAQLALMRADADAELALAMLRQDAARAEVEQAQERIDQLQTDMEKTK